MIPKGIGNEGEFKDAGFADQVPRSGPKFVSVGGREVILSRQGDRIVAFSGNCTHNFARLSEGIVEGSTIICPLHGARFDATTGKSQSTMCRDLPALPVKIEGRRILVQVG